jgi:carbon storage regulator
MLVLTRRLRESIMIGDDIEVKVLKIRGSQVHLGISAPHDKAVYRREVWVRVQEEAEALIIGEGEIEMLMDQPEVSSA